MVCGETRSSDAEPPRGYEGTDLTTRRNNWLGIAAMIGAMLCFVSNDALVKLSSEAIPIGEVVFLRGIASTLLVAGVIALFGPVPRWRDFRNPALIWRTIGDVGATVVYLTALTQLALGNATIVLQTVPLVVAAVGALVFKEHVGWRRWTAIAIGLAGVIIVIRPGLAGFNAYSLMAFVAVFLIVLRDSSTSRIPAAIPTITVLTAAVVATMVSGLAMGISETWHWPSGIALLEAFGAGVFVVLAYSSIIVALRSADISLTAPFRYTIIIWALLYGFLFWGDVPDALTIVGGALIVASGIFTLYREQRVGRADAQKTSIGGAGP